MPARTVLPPPTQTGETCLYTPTPKHADALPVAWVYPANYGVAMSSLGYLALFRQMDMRADVRPIRLSMDTVAQAASQDFPLVGFSFSFELDILNILRALQAMKLPLYSHDRDMSHPIVFAGGPVAMTNPEPYAPFLDCVLIGEGEELLLAFIDAVREAQPRFTEREALLRHLAATVPGVYVPALYDVTYQNGDDGSPNMGMIQAITPRFDDVPAVVHKQFIQDWQAGGRNQPDDQKGGGVTTTPILSPEAIFSDTFLIEVMRGCPHRCRFCLASYSMLPARGPTLEAITRAIDTGLQHTPKIGLLGALISEHPDFEAICQHLDRAMDARPDIRLSAASFRADRLSEPVIRTFIRGGQRQLTIAIESGSPTLRQRINKHLSQQAILDCVERSASAGLKGLKFYTMTGLPGETDDDIAQTIELMRTIKTAHKRMRFVVGSSSFVPKAGTPFQWQPRPNRGTIDRRLKQMHKGLLKVASFRPGSVGWDTLQAVLSRGDRRLAPFLERYTAHGGTLGHINRTLKDLREAHGGHTGHTGMPSLDWYALRERSQDEVLPWEVLHLGVDKAVLWREGQTQNMP